MKKIKISFLTIILIIVAGATVPVKSSAQASVSFQVFYDKLAPYGHWVTYPGYGYVWMPTVEAGFRPYVSGGHWVYSDAGWVWVSNYNWGWAPFHYGSWISDPSYGWLWVPGYDWAPAWVTWGNYNGYYGWAPVGPGFSISAGYYPPINNWCFIEPRYMTVNDWGNHYYYAHNNRIVINNTVIINERRISTYRNTSNYGGHAYYSGPRREEVERTTHATIRPVTLRESAKAGRMQVSGNAVNIYRPRIQSESRTASRPANVKPIENFRSSQGAAGRSGIHPQQNAHSNVNGAGQRTAGNTPARGNEKSRANQQLQPTYQHPTKKTEMKPAEMQRNNPAPVQREQGQKSSPDRQMQRQGYPMQYQQQANRTSSSAVNRQHQQMQSRQQGRQMTAPASRSMQSASTGRQATAPQQREQARREQPRQLAQAQHSGDGRSRNFR